MMVRIEWRDMARLQPQPNGRGETTARRRHSASPDVPPLGASIVFTELSQASEPLTTAALRERTLLPEPAINAALDALVAADGVDVLAPRMEQRPTRYVARAASSTTA